MYGWMYGLWFWGLSPLAQNSLFFIWFFGKLPSILGTNETFGDPRDEDSTFGTPRLQEKPLQSSVSVSDFTYGRWDVFTNLHETNHL